MIRPPLVTLLALGLTGAVPAGAHAASAADLLAQAPNGTLSDEPSPDLIAQTPKGTLSETPTASGSAASPSSSPGREGTSAAAPTAAALPFTGSDPRVLAMLGFAALLAGAGLRLRTRDARDF